MATAHAYAPAAEPAAVADPASLQKIHESLDIPGYRVEILQGRVVVSPSPAGRHGLITTWLIDTLKEPCEEHGLGRFPRSTVELATRERIEPDLLVGFAEEDALDEWLFTARDTVLVAEVVSPSSRRDDSEVKRRGCALSGIPLYLVVDPEAAVVTLYSEPDERGYLNAAPVPPGRKLILPDALGVTLDTDTMPIRRKP